MSDMSNSPKAPRGGAPVGQLRDLDPIEAASVLYLRLWCEGETGRARLHQDFVTTLGPSQGEAAVGAFEDLCGLCTQCGRRPLMRHSMSCACLGADESCFANLIALAGEGEREDAALLASLIVRPGYALPVADLAASVALAFRQMMVGAQLTTSPTLH